MNNLPSRIPKLKPISFILYISILYFVFISFKQAGFDPENLYLGERLLVAWEFIKDLYPPDFSRIVPMSKALLVTLQMALVGTFLGVIISLPLGVLAASNFSPNRLFYGFFRLLISFFRTVPDLIWALFFVITFGLGPLAGTLALVIDTIGFCARFFAESIEETEKGAVDGLTALGAKKLAIIVCGVFPACLPSFTNTALYSLEKAVRSSVVLGLVGAGGIGIELKVAMETFRYSEAATIILAIFIMVLLVERLSAYVRIRLME